MVFSLGLIGCNLNKPIDSSEYKPTDSPESFFQKDSLYTYSGSIDIYGRNVSGNLLIKRISQNEARLVFNHESGFQLMAFAFKDGDMSTHFVHEKLDKKLVLRTIEKDLRTLFFESQCQNALQDLKSYETICKKGKTEYRLQFNEDEKIEKILVRSGNKSELTVNFVAVVNGVPDTIRIDHQDIKLKYRFYRIRK